MSKKIFSIIGLTALMVLMTGVLAAAAPVPVTAFTLEQGLPETMNVGDTATVVVRVESDQTFLFAQALPSEYFPGRGVVAAQGDRAGQGTTAELSVPFTAKTSTQNYGGTVLVSVSVGVRYSNGYVATQRYDFYVNVP